MYISQLLNTEYNKKYRKKIDRKIENQVTKILLIIKELHKQTLTSVPACYEDLHVSSHCGYLKTSVKLTVLQNMLKVITKHSAYSHSVP